MEFAEVREYAPGDEVRTIDWNVTARMGAPYVKKFVEERDLTLLLLVDVSGSQAVRLAVPPEARLRGGARGGAGLLGGRQPRPGGRRALLRPHRGLRAPGPRPRPRAAHRARPARARARGPRHRPRGRAALRAARAAPPRHRGRHLRLPGRGLREGARGPAPAARRGRPAPARPAGGATCPRPGSWPSPTRRRGSAWWRTPRGRRCGGRCAPPRFEAARAVFKKTRVDALALGTGESYERPLSGFFKARERRR